MKEITCNLIYKIKNILHERNLSPVASDNIQNNNTLDLNIIKVKMDSGASKHFFKMSHLKSLKNVQKLINGPIAHLPNNTQVRATHKGTVHIHEDISAKASEVLVFPHIKNESLISIGQLCDDNCIVIFTKNKFYVTKMENIYSKDVEILKINYGTGQSIKTHHQKISLITSLLEIKQN